jgi:hypothetical protein
MLAVSHPHYTMQDHCAYASPFTSPPPSIWIEDRGAGHTSRTINPNEPLLSLLFSPRYIHASLKLICISLSTACMTFTVHTPWTHFFHSGFASSLAIGSSPCLLFEQGIRYHTKEAVIDLCCHQTPALVQTQPQATQTSNHSSGYCTRTPI